MACRAVFSFSCSSGLVSFTAIDGKLFIMDAPLTKSRLLFSMIFSPTALWQMAKSTSPFSTAWRISVFVLYSTYSHCKSKSPMITERAIMETRLPESAAALSAFCLPNIHNSSDAIGIVCSVPFMLENISSPRRTSASPLSNFALQPSQLSVRNTGFISSWFASSVIISIYSPDNSPLLLIYVFGQKS